jgi:hypothetical protein
MRNEQFDFPLSERDMMSLDQRARVAATSKPGTAKPQPKQILPRRPRRNGAATKAASVTSPQRRRVDRDRSIS